MPNRIVREGYLDSEAYASVDDSAKLVWHHMLNLADDFGCLSLAPSFVRRRLFYTQPSDATVARVLNQLADSDLIRIYGHEGGRYALIPRFRQRLQRMTLKHPAPPSELLYDDPWLKEKFEQIQGHNKKSITPANTVPNTLSNGPEEKRRKDIEASQGGDASEEKPQPRRSSRGTRLLPDWRPSVEGVAYCREKRPDLEVAEVADRFRDFWIATPGQRGVKLDWEATWRNWIRNERPGKAKGKADEFFAQALRGEL